MFLLLIFAFLAGIVTILSPCILPILPIVLSSSVVGGKRKPFGVVIGFILSFTFFTLFLSTIVKATGISADSLRFLSVIIIAGFGLSFLIPQFQLLLEKLFSKLSNSIPKTKVKDGFLGGVVIGLTLGLLWTPCVGPILASVISLALSGSVSGSAFLITLAYALGTAIPMFLVMYGGRELLNRNQWFLKNTGNIQKVFGIIMIITAAGIYFNIDRHFQTFILNTFPQYGSGLTKFEDNEKIKKQLEGLKKKNADESRKSLFNFNSTKDLGQAPALIEGGRWFNLPENKDALTIKELRGKVILVDFWTYTCINCIRTLPYLRTWHEKYKEQGLVIIGVHTPEFEFEKNADNLQKAISDFKLTYPIMQDNNFATWQAYDNHYWPAKYLIDKDGKIRYTHFGEGEYDETEQIIQDLLKETGKKVDATTISNPIYDIEARTPELYLGYSRIEYLASPEDIRRDSPAKYSAPNILPNNYFAYSGIWNIGKEYASPNKGSLLLNFESKEVYLVMKSKTKSSQAKVYLNGKIVDDNSAGEDIVDGIVTIDKDRLYKLIKLQKAERNTLRLDFLDDNAELFAFTFG